MNPCLDERLVSAVTNASEKNEAPTLRFCHDDGIIEWACRKTNFIFRNDWILV